MFADPAWDILLDLYVARIEDADVSISGACVAAAVPATTALRWIRQMEREGLIGRAADPTDQRRQYVFLTPTAEAAVGHWLSMLAAHWG